jgi:hypothetical protein
LEREVPPRRTAASLPSNGSNAADSSRRRLRGRRRVIAATVWVLVATLTLGLYFFSIPQHYDQLLNFSSNAIRHPHAVQVGLAELGLTGVEFAAFLLGVRIAFTASYFTVAAVVFWRRADDWMALVLSLVLFVFGVVFPNTLVAVSLSYPAIGLVAEFLTAIGFAMFFVLFLFFPDGRFVPRWSVIPAAIWLITAVLGVFFRGTLADPRSWPSALSILGIGLLIAVVPFSLVFRYRRVSDTVQRQQTKWVLFGVVAAIVGLLLGALPGEVFPVLQRPGAAAALYEMGSNMVYALSFFLIPIALGIAILRHRLYDVDPLINRALVYGSLTAALAVFYVAGIILFQRIFRAVIGQGSDLAIVISTLAIAALFLPLRRRFQVFVDRRFYRRKYDAEQALAAFSATLRNEVELNKVADKLLTVAEETMRPAHVSLWLRPNVSDERPLPSRRRPSAQP